MPLKLNVGVSRKLGLPEYSSVGASCQIEVELDSSLLQFDLDGFHAEVRGAFIAAQQAVNDQLVRSPLRLEEHSLRCVAGGDEHAVFEPEEARSFGRLR